MSTTWQTHLCFFTLFDASSWTLHSQVVYYLSLPINLNSSDVHHHGYLHTRHSSSMHSQRSGTSLERSLAKPENWEMAHTYYEGKRLCDAYLAPRDRSNPIFATAWDSAIWPFYSTSSAAYCTRQDHSLSRKQDTLWWIRPPQPEGYYQICNCSIWPWDSARVIEDICY